jgi:hypothetical protein
MPAIRRIASVLAATYEPGTAHARRNEAHVILIGLGRVERSRLGTSLETA